MSWKIIKANLEWYPKGVIMCIAVWIFKPLRKFVIDEWNDNPGIPLGYEGFHWMMLNADKDYLLNSLKVRWKLIGFILAHLPVTEKNYDYWTE